MNYFSTNNTELCYSFTDAILHGLAPDGGLLLPEQLPHYKETKSFLKYSDYPLFATNYLNHFVDKDTLSSLKNICKDSFNFPMPLTPVMKNLYALELFHGPTAAFKDIGAQFLAQCLNTQEKKTEKNIILVATSGDTGSAVANAFYNNPNYDVYILFPLGKVSSRQEKLLTCFGSNIYPIGIQGTFDDCQTLVKSCFTDPKLTEKVTLASANSINIGRLLPQSVYYAKTSVEFFHQHRTKPSFIIPTGNLGNALACIWAKSMGFPIERIIFANNANGILTQYLTTEQYTPHPSLNTLANAMDVGKPSNMERLLFQFPSARKLSLFTGAGTVGDEEIQATIRTVYNTTQRIICPHSATAYALALKKIVRGPIIVVETAHPAKFSSIIEPMINSEISIPENLAFLLKKSNHFETLPNDKARLIHYLTLEKSA